MKTDVIEPVGDEVFVAGIKDVSVIEQQDRGPLHEISFGNQAEAPSLKSVGDMLAGDDNAGLGNGKAVVRGAPLRNVAVSPLLRLEMDFEDSLEGTAHLVNSDFEQSKAAHHIQLGFGQGRK